MNNNIHRTIWNGALGAWVAAPETARARGRRSSGLAVGVTALLLAGLLPAGGAWAVDIPDPVVLVGDTSWVGGANEDIGFGSTVDGAYNLSVVTSGAKTFTAAVGGTTALASLTTQGGGTTVLHANVNTAGFQSYGDALVLGGNAVLTSLAGGSIGFGSTISGGADLSLSTAGTVQVDGAVNLRNLTVQSNEFVAQSIALSGNLSISTNQAIVQSSAYTVGGTSSFNAGSGGSITISNVGNAFSGAIHLNGGNAWLTNSIGTVLGASTVNGSLNATSGGALTQTGALAVTGDTTINAGTNAITLDNPANSFTGTLTLTGGAVSVASQGDMEVSDLHQNANSSLSLVAGGQLSLPNAAINTGTAGMSLRSNGGVLFTAGALSGSQIDLTGHDGITLVHDASTPGTLNLNSGAAIIQVSGALTANSLTGSSAGDTVLGNAGNQIFSLGDYSAANFTLFNGVPLTVAGTLSAGNISLTSAGGTIVVTGALNASGHTTVDTGTTLQIGTGGTQGSISGDVVNNGTLSFNRSGSVGVGGAVSGNGSLVKIGTGTLTLSGINAYTGGTQLLAGRIDVGSNSALGTGALDMADGTTLGFAANGLDLANDIALSGVGDPVVDTGAFDATLSGAISGSGFLTKEGSGRLVLSGANNYSGPTTVAAGTLAAGAANTFSASSAVTVATGTTLDLAGFNQRIAGLANTGTVSLLGATPGTVLTVAGPWVGNGGVLRLGTALGGNGSASDKVLLSGASAVASGSTLVQVTNLGGLGAQTTGNGIEIVATENGASIQAGAFTLAGTLSAGAYDYHLNTTNAGAYLSSTTNVVPPVVVPPVVVPPVVVPPVVAPPTSEAPAVAPAPVPTYRAEASLLAAVPEQLREAGLAMVGNLHQRVGDQAMGGSAGGARQGWGRFISVDRDIAQQGTVSPGSSGRQSGVQVGTDLWADPNWRAGVYVGQLEGEMDVTGFARGVQNYAAGSDDLRSQYLAGYATWRSDGGAYVDTVLQAGRLRYTAYPALASAASGKGNSVLASIELGQALQLAPGWTVEPQLQLASQHLSLDDLSLAGAAVQQDNDSAWLARIGVRVKGEIASGAGLLQPYARLNLYRRSSGTDTARFIGPAASTDIDSSTGGTSTELAVGATWQVTPLVTVYGEVGHLWASSGDTRTEGAVGGGLGLKVNW